MSLILPQGREDQVKVLVTSYLLYLGGSIWHKKIETCNLRYLLGVEFLQGPGPGRAYIEKTYNLLKRLAGLTA